MLTTNLLLWYLSFKRLAFISHGMLLNKNFLLWYPQILSKKLMSLLTFSSMYLITGFSGNYVKKTGWSPWWKVWTKSRWSEVLILLMFFLLPIKKKEKKSVNLFRTGRIPWDQMTIGPVRKIFFTNVECLKFLFSLYGLIIAWYDSLYPIFQ